MSSSLRLLAVVATLTFMVGGCNSDRQTSTNRIPGTDLALDSLKRSDYKILGVVTGTATVERTATLGQESCSILFGTPTFTGDYEQQGSHVVSFEGKKDAPSGASSTGFGNMQLTSLLGLGGLQETFEGKTAEKAALQAAYYKAIESTPGIDLLLEPRVKTVVSETNVFFGTRNTKATVTVTGKGISYNVDGPAK